MGPFRYARNVCPRVSQVLRSTLQLLASLNRDRTAGESQGNTIGETIVTQVQSNFNGYSIVMATLPEVGVASYISHNLSMKE